MCRILALTKEFAITMSWILIFSFFCYFLLFHPPAKEASLQESKEIAQHSQRIINKIDRDLFELKELVSARRDARQEVNEVIAKMQADIEKLKVKRR
jgi:hypothetical protein